MGGAEGGGHERKGEAARKRMCVHLRTTSEIERDVQSGFFSSLADCDHQPGRPEAVGKRKLSGSCHTL